MVTLGRRIRIAKEITGFSLETHHSASPASHTMKCSAFMFCNRIQAQALPELRQKWGSMNYHALNFSLIAKA